jgi:hypothetical protein
MKKPLIVSLLICALAHSNLPAADSSSQGGALTKDPGAGEKFSTTERLDLKMVKEHNNFGYTDEEIKTYFDYPLVYQFDFAGLAKDRIKPPPAPGIHPRVLFNPEELPDLRKRLAETKPGKMVMGQIRAGLTDCLTGPNAKFGAIFEAAARGEEDPGLLKDDVAYYVLYEAFRCLVDQDDAGGKKVAAAIATLAKMDKAVLDEHRVKIAAKSGDKSARDYQSQSWDCQWGLLGLGYDFAYNWMDDAQRATVRETLADATAGMSFIGQETLPALRANTSNWTPMHMRFIFMITAIEGEKGYDPAAYKRCVEGYKRYLTVNIFPAGEMFEGLGKNWIMAENVIPLEKRGENLLSLTGVRNQATGYYLHAMFPWGDKAGGNCFTFYDSLGGRGNGVSGDDLHVLKYLYPEDPTLDFVYRNSVGENYERFSGKLRFGHLMNVYPALARAIFAQDYDSSVTWDQALKRATDGKPLTYFSEDTCNLITASGWGPEALQLHFLTKAIPGGHVYADRTHFSVYGLGRPWAIYKSMRQVKEHYLPKNRSVILIDGAGVSTVMGKCVMMEDTPDATWIAADAKFAYDYAWAGPKDKDTIKPPFTGNDFRLHKSAAPWMDLPWGDLPNWQTSLKDVELLCKPNTPVQRAFRTSGLIRGKHPYVLVADDIQKDASPHEYRWNMILEDDLIAMPDANDLPADLTLGEKAVAPDKSRRMLVRVLQADGADPAKPAFLETDEVPNPPNPAMKISKLSVIANSVAPNFKVLLFPHIAGAEIPVTTFNKDRTQLTVKWSDQTDVLTFAPDPDGRMRISLSRNTK